MRVFLYGYLGNCYRIYGESEKAIYYLTKALDQSKTDANRTKEIISLVRLGEAYKYNHQHEQALCCFQSAIEKSVQTDNLSSYLDFPLQHQGKCLLEMGRESEAIQSLEEALELRKKKGDPSLIQSTQQTLDLAYKIKKNRESAS